MNMPDKDPLFDALQRLPREVQPDRDLWSSIATEISSSKPRARVSVARWAAAFAGLALTASVSYYALRAQIQSPASPTWFRDRLTPVAFGPGYQKTRLALANDMFRIIQKLSPEERAKVEFGLKQIDDGLHSIEEALQAHPDNVLLRQLVLSAYQQELQFMQDVSVTTHDVLGGNST